MKFIYYMPTKIYFGKGNIDKLSEFVNTLGKKAMVVIGKSGAMKRYGYLDKVTKQLKDKDIKYIVYDKILPNPLDTQVNEAAEIAKKEGIDFIIGLGGGSTIDSAKAIAITAKEGPPFWQYVHGGTGGRKTPKNALPIVAITTTSGTGTEADPFAVISKEGAKEKIGIGYEIIYPKYSIVDPELTLSLPKEQTAFTGMDAFFHALESYLNVNHQPTSDLLALEAMELINIYLPIAVKNGQNYNAREKLAWANTAAGICEALSGCIAHHSLEHALSAYYPEIPHGQGLIALGPAFFEYIAPQVESRLITISKILGAGKTAIGFVHALTRLIKLLDLPKLTLKDLGVEYDKIPELAENAFYTMGGLFDVTPVKLTKEDVIKIYQKAYDYDFS